MSASAALQKVILDALKADTAGTMAQVNGVYDNVPPDPWGARNAYISFGPHDVVDDGADCIVSGEHTFQLDAWSRGGGMVKCKRIVDAIYAVFNDQDFTISGFGIVEVRVDFRQVFKDPDGLTAHGVCQVTAFVEE